MDSKNIISRLPYSKPFLFVDEIVHIDENGVEGTYTFDENLEFYKGHFSNHPVTPGAILTEVMAQIGVVCLGVFLIEEKNLESKIAMTSTEMEFLKPVYPNEKVTVISKKIYFRFGKLKCEVVMKNAANEEVCHGTIAGIISN
jgi:3-hydroxyacyl-[acyl-carrier-protein] dehydratase